MLYIHFLEASQVNLIFSEPVPDDFIKKKEKKKAVQCIAHEISILIRAGHLPSKFGILHQNLICLDPKRLLHENFS